MKIILIGRGEYLYRTARLLSGSGHRICLVVTHKPAPEYRFNAGDFERLAGELGADFLRSPVMDENVMKHIERHRPDIGVSVNYSSIIPQEIIDLVPHGILNAHAGDLPRYKGNAPVAWAILNGEDAVGLCIHKMIGSRVDEGPIMRRDMFPLAPATRIGEVFAWLEDRIPQLLVEAVQVLDKDPGFSLEDTRDSGRIPLRCFPRLPEDGRIDWSHTNVHITRLVNASSEPFEGAYTYLQGKIFRVWRCLLLTDHEEWIGVPGQVANIDVLSGTVTVLTGDGKVEITDAEYEGERRPPAHFISSTRSRLR